MNAEQRWEKKNRAQSSFSAGRRMLGRRCLVPLLAMLIVCMVTCAVRSEASDGPEPTPSPSWAEAFPELAAACQPIGRFLFETTIVAGEGDQAGSVDAQRPWKPFSAGARITAYEENDHFMCATGEAPLGGQSKAVLVRRLVFLRPSLFLIDDFVRQPPSGQTLRWQLHCRGESTIAGRQYRVADGKQELVCETIWAAAQSLQEAPEGLGKTESGHQTEVGAQPDAEGVRWLQVMYLREAGHGYAPVESAVENKDGRLDLTITTAERTFRLSLPPPGLRAGRIAIQDADGETILPRRPFPSGVLPHGPEGRKLIERWDRAYRDGRRPGWDTGVPAKELVRVVDEGIVQPCRTAVLGCGSGTNAIYLASKGFDVTAIDVAPTALRLAEAKAEKAGVHVEWVLADVLALPEMEPFEFIFDRGCYHNVRYVDAAAFVESVRRISRPGTRFLVLSLNRDRPPGVREQHMRDDFSSLFEFEWLRDAGIESGPDGKTLRESWSLMLRRKP